MMSQHSMHLGTVKNRVGCRQCAGQCAPLMAGHAASPPSLATKYSEDVGVPFVAGHVFQLVLEMLLEALLQGLG